jgi:ribosomal protein S17
MQLHDFVKAFGRAQERSTKYTAHVEVYHANTGERFKVVHIYTDTDEERGPLVCIDVEPVE